MENAHFDTVMKHYNALYCNRTMRAVESRAGVLSGDAHTHYTLINALIDASLECCGHRKHTAATRRLFWLVRLFGDGCLEGLVFEHLQNFATEEHIETLKGITK